MNNENIVLDAIDKRVRKEILKTLKEIFKKYPKLSNSITLVSDINYLVNYLFNNYTVDEKDRYVASPKTVFTTAKLWLPKETSKNLNFHDQILYYKPDFIGIGVNDIIKYSSVARQLKSEYKCNWSYSKNIRDAFYHEIGHIFNTLFKLSNNPELKSFIEKNINRYSLSTYSKTNNEELIAEAFSKYSYDPKYNELVYIIGTVIEEYYLKFENTDLFEINTKSLIRI